MITAGVSTMVLLEFVVINNYLNVEKLESDLLIEDLFEERIDTPNYPLHMELI